MTDILEDEELNHPGKPDFRRVGRFKSPQVKVDGKRTTFGRFSNAGKILDDESNLVDWKLRTVVVGAANRPDLMAQVSTLNFQTDKNEIRDISEECLVAGKGTERSVKGTAIHAMFDHLDRNDDWEPAPQWLDLCNGYLETLDKWGLVPVDIEVNCVHIPLRLAGRMDRRYRTTKTLVAPDNSIIPIGSMIAADTKTGSVLEYAAGSYATQLAGYAHSQKYDVETDEVTPFEPPTFPDWGIAVHADSAGTEVHIYWVNLQAGLDGLKLAHLVKEWRRRGDLLALGTGPVMATSALAPSVAPTVAPVAPEATVALSGGWNALDHPDPTGTEPLGTGPDPKETVDSVDSLREHTRARVKAILEYSDIASKALARAWPVGVPGLKVGGHTWDQLQDIRDAVEKVEADYSVPFFPLWVNPNDSRDRHPSNSFVDKWTKPSQAPPANRQEVQSVQEAMNDHPRKELLKGWVGKALEGGIDTSKNTFALSHALLEFASISTEGWSTEPLSHDEQISLFLDGTLRALGYKRGLLDLGKIDPEHGSDIMSAAFSITSGTAVLLYGEDGSPVLRTNIVRDK